MIFIDDCDQAEARSSWISACPTTALRPRRLAP
jgi:hypothetical protein